MTPETPQDWMVASVVRQEQPWLQREAENALATFNKNLADREAPFRMRLAELHNTTGILEDFANKRMVPGCSPRVQGGVEVGLPEAGMYVSVWSVMPVQDPDRDYPGIFVGYGLIDGVADQGDSTNITIRPLLKTDSYYPFFPGTVRRYVKESGYPVGAMPKTCRGYMINTGPRRVAGIVCNKPITRVTEVYGNMACDSCYPHVQKQDEESLEAEKEMIADSNDPGRRYRD